MTEMDDNDILDVDTELYSSFFKGDSENIPEREHIMLTVQPTGCPLLEGLMNKISGLDNRNPVPVPQTVPGNSNTSIIMPEISNAFSNGFQPQPIIDETCQVNGLSILGSSSNENNCIEINKSITEIHSDNSDTLAIKPEHRCNVSDYKPNGLNPQPSTEMQPDDMINKPRLEILAPHKIKNPDYKMKVNPLGVTTKRNKPVRIKCEIPEGYKFCKICLRNEELASQENPVMICQSHQSENTIKEAPNSMFIVKGNTDVEYFEENGHICCIIKKSGEYNIYFLCWNNCKPHRANNKKINIHYCFSQNDSPGGWTTENIIKLVVRENLNDRCVTTVKSKANKRDRDSMMQDSPEKEIISKKNKDNEDDLDDPSPLSPEQEAFTICIYTDSKDRLDLYLRMANELGDRKDIITRDMIVNNKDLLEDYSDDI